MLLVVWLYLLHWLTLGLVVWLTIERALHNLKQRLREHQFMACCIWWVQPLVCISNEQPWISEANKWGHYRKATGSSNLFLWNMQAQACLCPRKRDHSLLYSLQDYGSLPSLIFNKQNGLVFFLLNKPIVESPVCFPPQVPVYQIKPCLYWHS